jgi:hypothetical protein
MTDIAPPDSVPYSLSEGFFMDQTAKIVEVARMGNNILVTFSDGRMTTLSAEQVHATSVEPPPEPDRSEEIERY